MYVILYLSVFSELLTKDYTESYYQEDGTRVTTVPNDIVSVCVCRQTYLKLTAVKLHILLDLKRFKGF